MPWESQHRAAGPVVQTARAGLREAALRGPRELRLPAGLDQRGCQMLTEVPFLVDMLDILWPVSAHPRWGRREDGDVALTAQVPVGDVLAQSYPLEACAGDTSTPATA